MRYDYWNIKGHHGTRYRNSGIIHSRIQPAFQATHHRMNLRYSLNDNHLLKAAIGNYSQYPQPWFANCEQFGNPELTTTKASHYIAGYEWKILDFLNIDFQIYFNKQWDKTRETTLQEQNNCLHMITDDGKAKNFWF